MLFGLCLLFYADQVLASACSFQWSVIIRLVPRVGQSIQKGRFKHLIMVLTFAANWIFSKTVHNSFDCNSLPTSFRVKTLRRYLVLPYSVTTQEGRGRGWMNVQFSFLFCSYYNVNVDFPGRFYYLIHPSKLTYDKAVSACQQDGAQIAKVGQMFAAWKLQGYDRCDVGWLADGSVRSPISRPRRRCSHSGAAVSFHGFPDKKHKLYGVYCFKGQHWATDASLKTLHIAHKHAQTFTLMNTIEE